MHTTWDRFLDAREIGDLFIVGGGYVDRIYSALKERGIPVQRDRRAKEAGSAYLIPLSILCKEGWLDITQDEINNKWSAGEMPIEEIIGRIDKRGGII